MSYFYLQGSDGERLCADVSNGALGYRANLSSEVGELILIRSGGAGERVLLCINHDRAAVLHGFVATNAGVILLHRETMRDGRIRLKRPDHKHYVTAVPLLFAVAGNAAIYCHSPTPGGWEEFSTEPVPAAELREFPAAVGKAAFPHLERLAFAFVSDTLRGDRSDVHRALALALVPGLSHADLSALGKAALKDPAMLRAIQDFCPGDPWAWQTLPTLAAWHRTRARDASALHRRLPEASNTGTRDIDGSFYYAGTTGYFGELATLAHICTVYARAAIEPTRGCCVVATARSEGVYLLEWIAYHQSIGVEHFFIYTNDNEDGSDALLSALADNGVITWIRNIVTPGSNAQAKAYGHALSILPDILDFEWVMVIDLDEFFVFEPAMVSSLPSYLAWQSQQAVDAVAVNWTFVGSTGQTRWSAEPLSSRNTKLLTYQQVGDGWRLVKTISRPNRVIHSEPHFPRTDGRRYLVRRQASGQPHVFDQPPAGFGATPAFTNEVDVRYATIYHYIFKSAEETLWRNARNRGDRAVELNERSIRHVSDNDCHAYVVQETATALPADDRMQVCSRRQAEFTARLLSLPDVAAAYQTVLSAFATRMEQIRASYRRRLRDEDVSEAMRQVLAWAGL